MLHDLTPGQARGIAEAVAAGAGRLVLEGWGQAQEVRAKALPTDLVTEWDTRSEEHIVAELARLAPGTAIVGEEGGARGGHRDGRWLVDPIDGTVNFAHGLPIFGVSIAWEEGGRQLAGAVCAPALGWLFSAAAGEGARRCDLSLAGGAPLRASAVGELSKALLATGFPYDRGVSARNNFAPFEHMQRRAGAVRRLGAASLDLCFVACGWLDGYWELKLKAWDLAAGAVIVSEAGGRVTALDGGPFVADSGEIVASNSLIHDQMIAELRGRTD